MAGGVRAAVAQTQDEAEARGGALVRARASSFTALVRAASDRGKASSLREMRFPVDSRTGSVRASELALDRSVSFDFDRPPELALWGPFAFMASLSRRLLLHMRLRLGKLLGGGRVDWARGDAGVVTEALEGGGAGSGG